jgi:hypothetical protein
MISKPDLIYQYKYRYGDNENQLCAAPPAPPRSGNKASQRTEHIGNSLEEAIERLQHLKVHFMKSYRYVVGEWSGGRRAKDTSNGQFVTKEEVISYLEANAEE